MTTTESIGRFGISTDTQACINCKHFFQHYVLDSLCPGYCTPIYSGHCCYPRHKYRKVCDVCEHFDNKHGPGKE